jgi:hypothetical protein
MLVEEGGFCLRSNSNIDIKLHKPTPTDLKNDEMVHLARQP